MILELMGQPARRLRPRHRPRRPRPALRDRLDQAAHRAGLGAAVRRLRGRPRRDDRLVPRRTRPGGGRRRTRPRPSTPRRASEPRWPAAERSTGRRPIPGLLVFDLPVHGDNRGWFKENWQREKMIALGLPDFGPVQNNVSFNDAAGTTRGIHAEPWDKFVSVATGRIFGAWVDLREGPTFGAVFTARARPVTRDLRAARASATRTRRSSPTPPTPTWSTTTGRRTPAYTFLNLADETRRRSPGRSRSSRPSSPTGPRAPAARRRACRCRRAAPSSSARAASSAGRCARAARRRGRRPAPTSTSPTRPSLAASLARLRHDRQRRRLHGGRRAPRRPRAGARPGRSTSPAVAALAGRPPSTGSRSSTSRATTSSTAPRELHDEDEPFSPLGVYGQTKAAGDALVATVPRHYIVRTSWVDRRGQQLRHAPWPRLADRGVDAAGRRRPDRPAHLHRRPRRGRSATCSTTDAPVRHLQPHATAAPDAAWADIARAVFELAGTTPAPSRR